MTTTNRTRSKAQPGQSGVKAVPRRVPTRTYTPTPFCSNPFDADAIGEHSDAVRSAPWLSSLDLPTVEARSQPPHVFRILCAMPDLETPRKVYEHFDDETAHLRSQAWDSEDSDEVVRLVREADAIARRRDIAADFNLQLRLMKLAEMPGFVVDVIAENECAVESVYELRFADRFVDPATYDVVFVDANDRHAMALARCGAKRVVLVGDCKNQPAAVAPTLTALYDVVREELDLRRRQLHFDWAAPELPLPRVGEDDAAVDDAIIRLTSAST